MRTISIAGATDGPAIFDGPNPDAGILDDWSEVDLDAFKSTLLSVCFDPEEPDWHRLILRAFATEGLSVRLVERHWFHQLWSVRLNRSARCGSPGAPFNVRRIGARLRRQGGDYVPRSISLVHGKSGNTVAFRWSIGGPIGVLVVRRDGSTEFIADEQDDAADGFDGSCSGHRQGGSGGSAATGLLL